MNPSVSFICSTFNRPELLKRLIENLLAQTNPYWELLVMDEDQENKPSSKIVADFNDPRIHYFSCKRFNDFGYSVKELGAEEARGEYLCFPADDAQYTPDFIEKMIIPQTDLVICDWHFSNISSNITVSPVTGAIDVGGFLVKKSVFDSVKFFDKGAIGDGLFIEEVSKRFSWTRVPDILYIKS